MVKIKCKASVLKKFIDRCKCKGITDIKGDRTVIKDPLKEEFGIKFDKNHQGKVLFMDTLTRLFVRATLGTESVSVVKSGILPVNNDLCRVLKKTSGVITISHEPGDVKMVITDGKEEISITSFAQAPLDPTIEEVDGKVLIKEKLEWLVDFDDDRNYVMRDVIGNKSQKYERFEIEKKYLKRLYSYARDITKAPYVTFIFKDDGIYLQSTKNNSQEAWKRKVCDEKVLSERVVDFSGILSILNSAYGDCGFHIKKDPDGKHRLIIVFSSDKMEHMFYRVQSVIN